MMSDATRKKVLARLSRIAGQVEGIVRMVEEVRYCVDVLLQIAAGKAGLGQSGKLVLRSRGETCVSEAMAAGNPVARQQKIDELMQVSSRCGYMGRGAAG